METEGKWRMADLEAVRERLRTLRAEPAGVREERNLLLDRPGIPLLGPDCTLRLRILGDGKGFLTYKGPRQAGSALKVRPEFETGLEAPEAMLAILEAMGFHIALEYAKTREIWRLPTVEVSLDTFYGDTYVEVEGEEEEVFRVATQLGLAREVVDLEPYSHKKAVMDTRER